MNTARRHTARATRLLLAAAACTASLVAATGTAAAGTYGSPPVNISVGRANAPADGASGEPAVSGDNRKVRIVAFSSLATNLVPRDRNGRSDIFVWHRPSSGGFPRTIGRGSLERVSLGARGREANGGSSAPAVDGSMERAPHCVAFQSQATNLSPQDALPDSDIYLRDLRAEKTVLISRGIRQAATNPSISGNCRKVVFEAGGKIWRSSVGGTPQAIGRGSAPAYSRDGNSIVFVRGGRVVYKRGGFEMTLSRGSDPRVSDYSTGYGWAVVYNSGRDVKIALINRARRSIQTAVRNAIAGGVTSRAAHRGIVVWARKNALYYLNRNTGNSDDLAYANTPITEIDVSARANLIAFSAAGGRGFIDVKGNTTPSVYVKWLPK